MRVIILTRPGDNKQHFFNSDVIVDWTETSSGDRGKTELVTVGGARFVMETPAEVLKKIREAD